MDLISVVNRSVLVTGGARGIGKEISEAFLANGARVAVIDLQVAAEALGDSAAHTQDRLLIFEGDVTEESFVGTVVERIVNAWGSLDVLINNAGIMYKAPIEEIDISRWNRAIEINLTGPVVCAKKAIPCMKERGWGRVINISSMMAYVGAETYSAYAAAKAGLLQLTKCWAVELAREGITVNAICPGWVETPMVEGFIQRIAEIHGVDRQGAIDKIFALVPQRRFIAQSEIAALALFLASDLAKGINGAGIVIDTGLTAGMPAGLHRKLNA
jgi:3-hydroxybutyrate dehydrogenase